MNWRIVSLIMLVFILGWLTKGVYSSISNDLSYFEWNSGTDETKVKTIDSAAKDIVFGLTDAKLKEKHSPYDRIKESQIHVQDNKVIIDIENPEWSKVIDTNSMDPLIDVGTNAIHIVPTSESEIHLGDIVAYESEYTDGTILHRIIEINKDEKGTYYILKGDNNPNADPGKVRFRQIKRVLVAIIY